MQPQGRHRAAGVFSNHSSLSRTARAIESRRSGLAVNLADANDPPGWARLVQDYLVRGDHPIYMLLYFGMIVFFTFFYTAVTFNPVDVAENLKKGGGFVPGIRPGKKTAEYIDRVLSRITCGGAAYLSAVCLMPVLLQKGFGVPMSFTGIFGGTALLIIVGVALDTVQQVESFLITRNYEGFSGPKGPRIRGRTTTRKG